MTSASADRSPGGCLVRLGWDAGWDAAWAAADLAPAVDAPAAGAPAADAPVLDLPGRVTRIDRGLSSVLTAAGPVRVGLGGSLLDRVAAEPTEAPVAGDWVRLRQWADLRTTLEQVLPRRTTLVRATPSGGSHSQLLAANATVVAVVVGLVPDPGIAKIERLLSVAWGSGARPVLVLAKADLVRDAHELAVELGEQAPGVEVLVCSTATGAGIDAVRTLVGNAGTLALLGSSGAGKSSLVNALVGTTVLTERSIRADGRGRHTSVRRELVPLPGGGSVIDTPGLRGVGLAAGTPAGDEGLARVFADVHALAEHCRFGDCRHDREPGCEVLAALGAGRLPPRRLDAWRRLQRELAWTARRASTRPPR